MKRLDLKKVRMGGWTPREKMSYRGDLFGEEKGASVETQNGLTRKYHKILKKCASV